MNILNLQQFQFKETITRTITVWVTRSNILTEGAARTVSLMSDCSVTVTLLTGGFSPGCLPSARTRPAEGSPWCCRGRLRCDPVLWSGLVAAPQSEEELQHRKQTDGRTWDGLFLPAGQVLLQLRLTVMTTIWQLYLTIHASSFSKHKHTHVESVNTKNVSHLCLLFHLQETISRNWTRSASPQPDLYFPYRE